MNAIVRCLDAALTQQPYTGPSGRTRIERVRVFRAGHEPLEVDVFRVVNVEESPELRGPALSGALHRLDDGEPIEVPFIYHDPEAFHFILVIPEGARGRELSERAQLLDSLMKEQEREVPDYVRRFTIVYGFRGLASHLDDVEPMEVDLTELEPIDRSPACSPRPRSGPSHPPSSRR